MVKLLPNFSGVPDPPVIKFYQWLGDLINKPVTYFKESIVEPMNNRNKQYYYHRRFRRVPTIDECYTDDQVCMFEANEQYKRDKKVDNAIMEILRQRHVDCEIYYGMNDADTYCMKLYKELRQAEADWMEKYGDLGSNGHVVQAYMKQKHKLVWERRHGKVGSGMKEGQKGPKGPPYSRYG